MFKIDTLVNFTTWQGDKLNGMIKEIFVYNDEEYARIETANNIKDYIVKVSNIKAE